MTCRFSECDSCANNDTDICEICEDADQYEPEDEFEEYGEAESSADLVDILTERAA